MTTSSSETMCIIDRKNTMISVLIISFILGQLEIEEDVLEEEEV